ncbi:beta-methylgalactoside transporter inner membrane component [Devosia equisanguinis]|uniref:Beta-methylgalactoside transporter inner membrane component n=1 Tax=Devosia equisanguinis TaxID=2490941 RepID=A0A447I6X6_9HYPH|nr:ABC transporter permease [Devosia equisanguinis]VDS03258.1 beta-methylgalactoside transporter inner membrane component [Devosia equisanguinis]
MSMMSSRRWQAIGRETGRALTALVIALGVALVVILATSSDPAAAFNTLLTAPLSSNRTIGNWIDDVAKLTLTGLAFSLVFQARQFSMGVQGQVYMGGLFAAFVAMSPIGTTGLAIPLAMLAAMAAGAVYGFIPGYAKARFGASEIVSSLMLNYIAILVVNYLIRAHLAPAGTGQLMTAKFPDTAIFPAILPGTRFDLGIVIALVATFVVWFLLYRTNWGLKLRLVGDNPKFAEYAGIRSSFIMVSAMSVAGAFGGLLGAVFVQGRAFGNLAQNFDGNLAFEGILIAIVARSRPLAVPFVALGYGYLRQGAQLMGLRTDVPSEMISVVQAIIILLVASSFSLPGRKVLARLFGRPSPAAATAEIAK